MLETINRKWFLEDIKNCEYIICIGAGKGLCRTEKFFEERGLVKKIKYVADNDCHKQGTEIAIHQSKIVIQSVTSLLPVLKQNVIVIITCLQYSDILSQLESYDAFAQAKIYSFTHIYDAYYDEIASMPNTFRLSDKMLIPKTIHYCWFGRNPIPEKNKRWMESWGKYCPDYEIIEWNEDNYDITRNQYMLQAYECKKWGFVPDYARLDIIYNYGGIYLDTDVELIKNLDDLLYQRGFAGFESDKYVALGLGFGAVAGNKIIKGMLDSYVGRSFIDRNGNMDLTTGPLIQTEYLVSQGLLQNGKYQILKEELTIFPIKIFNGISCNQLMPYTHSIHYYDASWMDEKMKMAQMAKEF